MAERDQNTVKAAQSSPTVSAVSDLPNMSVVAKPDGGSNGSKDSDGGGGSSYVVEFASPNRRIAGENASKLLKVGSRLFNWVQQVRQYCIRAGMVCDTSRAPHIEVLRQSEKYCKDAEALVAKRANELEGRVVELQIDVMNQKAVVVSTGMVSGYDMTHLTLVYFRDKLSVEQLAQLQAFTASSGE
jgi:hypothetical protein